MSTEQQTVPDYDEIVLILIREGFLQEEHRDQTDRVMDRWALRAKQNQVSVRDLKERGHA